MAITLFGSTSVPADNGTSTATQITLTPPSSMQTGDLVYVHGWQRGSATISVGVTGGQSWTSNSGQNNGASRSTRTFYCVFNGTWSADPRIDFTAGTCTGAVMLVFRPSEGYTMELDVAETLGNFTAGLTPFTKTITGINRSTTQNSVAIAHWVSEDDNTWGTLSGANWSKSLLSDQYRNTSGSDMSATYAYAIGTGATGNVSQNQASLGGDAGYTSIIAFRETPTTYTQAEAAFYEDGTESGSSVIDSGADSIIRDVSGGDSNLQLRLRLQETTGVGGASTDDYQLQYSRNGNAYIDIGIGDQIDGYALTNQSSTFFLQSTTGLGQSFTGNGWTLSSARAMFRNSSGVSGDVTAEIYAHTGTFGSTGTPTGAVLATSDAIAKSSITGTMSAYTFTFSGANQITLSDATKYFLVFKYSGSDNNTLTLGIDETSPGHGGNFATYNGSSWTADSATDAVFSVHSFVPVLGYDSSNLTDGAATTNRLGSGSGSFVAGKIAEDGLLDNLQITASNYSELLYSLTIESTAVSDSDTIDFRVLRNGAATGLTYTVTPTITITAGIADLTVNKSDSISINESVSTFTDTISASVSDSIATSESIVRLLQGNISKSDLATVTEFSNINISLSISVSDSVAITENVDPELVLFVTKSDSISLSESTNPLIPNLGITRSDNISVSENVDPELVGFVRISDSITTAESVGVSVETLLTDPTISVSDSASVSEAIGRQLLSFINRGDSLSTSESVKAELQNRILTSDSVTITESRNLLTTGRVSVSDSVSTSENVATGTESYISRSDAITVSESSTVVLPVLLIGVSDSLSVSDSVTARLFSSRSVSDSVSIGESIRLELSGSVNRSDLVTVTENRQVNIALSVRVSDSFSVTESTGLLIPQLIISTNDSVSVTEVTNVSFGGGVVMMDSASITENVSLAITPLLTNVSDTLILSESVKLLEQSHISKSDSITITESISVSLQQAQSLSISVSDSTISSESASILITTLSLSVSDNTSVSELIGISIIDAEAGQARTILLMGVG